MLIQLNYKLLLFLISLSLINSFGYAQTPKETRLDDEFPTPVAFPYAYLGEYSGNLSVSDQTGTVANIPTDFTIKPSDKENVFVYQFSYYQKDGKQTNVYHLHIIDEEKGYYAISDNKGMEFTATLINGVLYSTYDTKDKIMFTSLQFTNNDKLRFKIILSLKNKTNDKLETTRSNVVQVQSALLSKKTE